MKGYKNSIWLNLSDEILFLSNEMLELKNELTYTIKKYNNDYPYLRDKIIKHLSIYTSPEEDRHITIKKTALNSIHSFSSWQNDHIHISSMLGTSINSWTANTSVSYIESVFIKMNSILNDAQLGKMEKAINEEYALKQLLKILSTDKKLKSLKIIAKNELNDKNASFNYLGKLTITIQLGNIICNFLRLYKAKLDWRIHYLNVYCDEHISQNYKFILKRLIESIQSRENESQFHAISEIIMDSALGKIIPYYELLNTWGKFKETVLDIPEKYRKRGHIDNMFDFHDHVEKDLKSMEESRNLINLTVSITNTIYPI